MIGGQHVGNLLERRRSADAWIICDEGANGERVFRTAIGSEGGEKDQRVARGYSPIWRRLHHGSPEPSRSAGSPL